MSKSLELGYGICALVDDEDYERCLLFKWSLHPHDATCYARMEPREPMLLFGQPVKQSFARGGPDAVAVERDDSQGELRRAGYHSGMHEYQSAFLRLALAHGVLKFGEFKLKSGRISPYFFNLGLISSGAALRALGRAYAQALVQSGLGYDMLFGPAYKGIPLVAAVSIALADGGRDTPYSYNRKEAKNHGEGGTLVGAAPKGRVVIVDDVLTAGTA